MKVLKVIVVLISVFFILLVIISPKPLDSGGWEHTGQELSHSLIKGIVNSLKLFKLDNGTYPSKKEGLKALVKNVNPKNYPNYATGAYSSRVPLDAWQNPFIYIRYKTEKGDAFQLISFGADGKYGGEGEDADIVYPPIKKKKLDFFEWLFQK